MELFLNIDIPPLPNKIKYQDNIMLIGSCFTENMSERLANHKFRVLSNPHGILFNPLSVAYSIHSYLDKKLYAKEDLFYLNELWNSWDHHTRFSHTDAARTLAVINGSQEQAAAFLKNANKLIITLGSAFQYHLKEDDRAVANNHRAPGQWFEKRLLSSEEISQALASALDKLFAVNPGIQVVFTISPVRHIRDGVTDNNRSKARLIEAVHSLCSRYEQAYYFPAYELVIDVLRDYRFYDIDMVHPNFAATSFVWEHFVKACMGADTRDMMKDLADITIARGHRARFPETEAHKKFLASYAAKVKDMQERYPYLQLEEELAYFLQSS